MTKHMSLIVPVFLLLFLAGCMGDSTDTGQGEPNEPGSQNEVPVQQPPGNQPQGD